MYYKKIYLHCYIDDLPNINTYNEENSSKYSGLGLHVKIHWDYKRNMPYSVT
jgi:hypothetical protein